MNNYFKRDVITTILGIVGIAGLGYGLAMHTKVSKISDRLDKTIDELAYDMEIDIPEELVNKAVEKAVATEVKKAVERATNEAVNAVKSNIRSTVSSAVDDEYNMLKDSVLKEIAIQASKINVDKVRRDVEKTAEKMALEKFDTNLDDILGKFNSDLENTARVYQAIRTMITPANPAPSKEYVLKLG